MRAALNRPEIALVQIAQQSFDAGLRRLEAQRAALFEHVTEQHGLPVGATYRFETDPADGQMYLVSDDLTHDDAQDDLMGPMGLERQLTLVSDDGC